MLALFIILWFLSGMGSFIYWWTKDFDFAIDDLPICILCGFIGVLAFPVGWFIHGDVRVPDITIFKKGDKND